MKALSSDFIKDKIRDMSRLSQALSSSKILNAGLMKSGGDVGKDPERNQNKYEAVILGRA